MQEHYRAKMDLEDEQKYFSIFQVLCHFITVLCHFR